MGRKGVGKLSVLSISKGFKMITVKKNHAPIGLFIPNKIDHDDEVLRILNSSEYELKKIVDQGTAIIMENPKIKISKLQSTIIDNLSKIFPNNIEDFKIHVIYKGLKKSVIPTEANILKRLATFISIGDEKKALQKYLPLEDPEFQKEHIKERSEIVSMESIMDLNKEEKLKLKSENKLDINLKIYGWIGTYKTTRGMKKEINEFQITI